MVLVGPILTFMMIHSGRARFPFIVALGSYCTMTTRETQTQVLADMISRVHEYIYNGLLELTQVVDYCSSSNTVNNIGWDVTGLTGKAAFSESDCSGTL
jgi:hypothetical protein